MSVNKTKPIPSSRERIGLVLMPGVYAAIVSLLYAASVHRSLAHEGGFQYWYLLRTGRLCWDHTLNRFMDLAVQVPSWLAIRLGATSARVPIVILDLVYALIPSLSILATVWLLWRRNLTSLIVFPIFAFATSILSTTAYGIGQALYGLCFFWPLLILVLFPGKHSRAEQGSVFLLSLALAGSHESSGLLFFLLAALGGWRYLRQNHRTQRDLFTFVLMLGGCLWYLYRYVDLYYTIAHPPSDMGLPRTPLTLLLKSMLLHVDTFRRVTFAATGLFALAVFLIALKPHRRAGTLIAGLSAAVSLVGFVWIVHKGILIDFENLSWTRDARTSATPVGAVVAVVLWTFGPGLAKRKWETSAAFPIVIAAAAAALLLGIYRDFSATREWMRGWNYYQGLMKQAACTDVVDVVEGGPVSYNSSFNTYNLLVMQESRTPLAVVFFDWGGCGEKRDLPPRRICDTYDGREFLDACGAPPIIALPEVTWDNGIGWRDIVTGIHAGNARVVSYEDGLMFQRSRIHGDLSLWAPFWKAN